MPCRERQGTVATWSLQFHDGYAGSAKLDVLVAEVVDVWHGSEILACELAKSAGACAMEYSHLADAEENGVVDIVCELNESFVSTEATYVELLLEGVATIVHYVILSSTLRSAMVLIEKDVAVFGL